MKIYFSVKKWTIRNDLMEIKMRVKDKMNDFFKRYFQGRGEFGKLIKTLESEIKGDEAYELKIDSRKAIEICNLIEDLNEAGYLTESDYTTEDNCILKIRRMISSLDEWVAKADVITLDEAKSLGIIKEFNSANLERNEDGLLEIYADGGTSKIIDEVAQKYGLNVATYVIEDECVFYFNSKVSENKESYFLTRNADKRIIYRGKRTF